MSVFNANPKRFVLAIAMLSVAAALLFGPTTASRPSLGSASVCASEGGTCCTASGSTCYPNNCSDPSCAQQNAYWQDTGPCK